MLNDEFHSSSQSLNRELHELKSLGIHEFDPALFTLVESLVERASRLPKESRELLEERARKRLLDFHASRNRARDAAASALENIGKSGENLEIKVAFEQGDYRRANRVYRCFEVTKQRITIDSLIRKTTPRQHVSHRKDVAQLELRAQLQEQVNLPLFGDAMFGDSSRNDQDEMLSFRLFREAAAEDLAGKEVGRAAEEAPDNPGPLNGYALSTETLEHIKTLSPVYLKRFISWLDGLASLYALPDP